MKLSWEHKEAKSFGNGILRVSLKDVLWIAGILIAAGSFWSDRKSERREEAKQNAEIIRRQDDLAAAADAIQVELTDVKNRVLVLETIEKTTKAINLGVQSIKREEIFDPNVSTVKVKR